MKLLFSKYPSQQQRQQPNEDKRLERFHWIELHVDVVAVSKGTGKESGSGRGSLHKIWGRKVFLSSSVASKEGSMVEEACDSDGTTTTTATSDEDASEGESDGEEQQQHQNGTVILVRDPQRFFQLFRCVKI